MSSLLPSSGPSGILPYWLLLLGVAAFFNSIQTHLTLSITRKVYDARPQDVTGLSSRTFGTWTLLAGIIRLYAAYNVDNQAVYDMAILANLAALHHFGSELVIHKTATWRGLVPQFLAAVPGTVWMVMQRGYYTGA